MLTPDHNASDYEVSPRLLAIARALGIREVTARWKLIRLQRWWRGVRENLTPTSRRFDSQICPSCGALQARTITVCDACGKSVGTRAGAFFRTVGLSIPQALSASSALGVAMVIIYARMMLARPGEGFLSWNTSTLIEFGGDMKSAVHAGQWWRLGTAIFLHIGLWHLAFNLIALAQVGPAIEQIYGRGRMIFFFLLTGVVANVGSETFGQYSVSAGASGALMGLIGIAAGWGQRAGTTRGKYLRNQMLKWAAYTMLFGFYIHANNWAHGFGFVSGGLIGVLFHPRDLEARQKGISNAILGALGLAATGVIVFLCLQPPAASVALAAPMVAAETHDDSNDAPLTPTRSWLYQFRPACELLANGKTKEAIEILRAQSAVDTTGPELVTELRSICAGERDLDDKCRRMRTEGAAALVAPGLTVDPVTLDHLYQTYQKMCAEDSSR